MDRVLVLGGGLTGLAAARELAAAGLRVTVCEREPVVGGLARTVVRDGYRFDLGGHRLFTRDPEAEALIRALLGPELLRVPRRSRILLRGRYFDYPLTPGNALFGVGPRLAGRILWDYVRERVRPQPGAPPRSLEEWVVRRFGRTMYRIYFQVYSEKVWGIPAPRVSAEWVAQRIQGLSLGRALAAAFRRAAGRDLPTLAEHFLYPSLGAGRLAEALAAAVAAAGGAVATGAAVERVWHDGRRVEAVEVCAGGRRRLLPAPAVVSTMPLPGLISRLHPQPPAEVRAAAARLRYRALVVVCVFLARERVTDLSWLYVPDPLIPFGRLHEPRNWSPLMAPPGRTHLVAEHFCFPGDPVWRAADDDLVAGTAHHLARLGLVRPQEVLGGAVVRLPAAYPLLDVDYRPAWEAVMSYLDRFANLAVAGRTGAFRYLNMDHALMAGRAAAAALLARDRPLARPAAVGG